MADGPGRIQTLGADLYAVHDAAAAEYAEGVIHGRQTALGLGGTAIRQEAVGLQQTGGTDELVRVPPEGRAGRGAACTENALVQTVQLRALFRRLQTLDSRRRRVILQIRLNFLVLLVEDAHIHDQVTDYRQTRQRTQYQLVVLHYTGQRSDASEAVLAVDVHPVGTAHTFTAGATEAQTGILFLGQLQNVKHHQILTFGIDLEVLHVRSFVGLRVITINTDFQHTGPP